MKIRFLILVLSSFCFFLSPVAAQEQRYMVTEMELTQLESISESLVVSRQNLLLQANALTERLRVQELKASSLAASLQQAEQTANNLNSQLQTERESLKALRQSYNAYEQEAAAILESKQAENERLTRRLYRRTIALVVSISLLVGISLLALLKWYLKGRLRIFTP